MVALVVELKRGQMIVVLEWVVLLIEQCWGGLVILVEWATVLDQWNQGVVVLGRRVVVLGRQFLCGQLEALGMDDNRVRRCPDGQNWTSGRGRSFESFAQNTPSSTTVSSIFS